MSESNIVKENTRLLFETSTVNFHLAIYKSTVKGNNREAMVDIITTPIISMRDKQRIIDTEDGQLSTHRQFPTDISMPDKDIILLLWNEFLRTHYVIKENKVYTYHMPSRIIEVSGTNKNPYIKVMYRDKKNLFDLFELKYNRDIKKYIAERHNADSYIDEITLDCKVALPYKEGAFSAIHTGKNYIVIAQWSKKCHNAVATIYPVLKCDGNYRYINAGPIIHETVAEYVPTADAMAEFFQRCVYNSGLDYYTFNRKGSYDIEHRWMYNGEPSVAIDISPVYMSNNLYYSCVDFRDNHTLFYHDTFKTTEADFNNALGINGCIGTENNLQDVYTIKSPDSDKIVRLPRLIPFDQEALN